MLDTIRTTLTLAGRGDTRAASLLTESGTMLGLFLILILLIPGILAPWLGLDDPTAIDLTNPLVPPSWERPLGTDHLSRDTLSRIVYGARTTLASAALTLELAMAIALGGWPTVRLFWRLD